MAAVAPTADQATDLLQKLSLDSQTKTHDVNEVTKKYGSVDGGEVAGAPVLLNERSTTSLLQDFMDPNMCYLPNGYTSPAYYYGAYDGSINEWEDYSRYVNPEELSSTGIYSDMYHHGYGYAPYSAYPPPPGSPVPAVGHDGQLYAPQHYQYPGPYYQPPSTTGSTFTPIHQVPTSQADVSTSVAADQPPIPVDAKADTKGVPNVNMNGTYKIGNTNGSNGSAPLKPSPQNPSLISNGSYGRGVLSGGLSSGYHDPRFAYDGVRSPIPWIDSPAFPDGQHRLTTSVSSAVAHTGNNLSTRNQNLRPLPHLMGLHSHRPTSGMGPAAPGSMSRIYPNNRMYGQCGNAFRTELGFGSNCYDSRANGYGWLAVDSKYKPRGRGNGFYGYGNENMGGVNELNRGPRSGRFKNQKVLGPNVTIAVKGQNLPLNDSNEDSNVVPDKDQYNKADFPEKYSEAKFFVIKSYSEDDVHKSVKYNVWASTPNGNKKLDAGFKEAQEKAGGCPVFLFFSVNGSGQFVGVAEMVAPVDFNKTVDYWQQDKWNGCFPVKWVIVKDVPNSILKHITLENNDHKPVTNSRDTQEVKLEQGLQMLKLFKEHASKTSILDDFSFYEERQKAMQEKRVKQQQFQRQVWDGKPTGCAVEEKDNDVAKTKPRLQKPLEKETVQGALGERKPLEENGVATVVNETPKVAKLATEKWVVSNGVTNGC